MATINSRQLSTSTLVRSDSGIDVISLPEVNSETPSVWESKGEKSFHKAPKFMRSTSFQPYLKKFWPPRGPVAKWLTWAIVLGLTLGAIWALLPDYMKPGKSLFGLTVTIIMSLAAEQLVVRIPTPKNLPPLPPLLASLLMGVALRNIPGINVAKDINDETGAMFREIALTVILTRAGLEIEPEAMKKVKWAVVRLAFMPCIAETTCIGILAHFILGFPFEWSFMTGFMIAAVSPAVVIPSVILLQDAGWGVAKGVPSLVMAASGIDDVLAIAGFTVLLGIAIPSGLEDDVISHISDLFYDREALTTTLGPSLMNQTNVPASNATDLVGGHNNIGKEIGGAILEVVIGIISGLVLGFFISYIPSAKMKYKAFCRGFLLLSIGILFVFGSSVWGIPGAGALCALITSFTASLHWKEEAKPLAEAWHYFWTVFQPVLFGLTGSLIDVSLLDGTTVGLGLATLFVALIGRLIVSTSVTFGLNFNLKERIFVSVAWIPKGTVQAALGSAALDLAHAQNASAQEIKWGEQILVLAVLITLITAPIGGFGISITGPRLLANVSESNPSSYENKAYDVNGEDNSASKELDIGSSDTESGLKSGSSDKKASHSNGLELQVKDLVLDQIREEDEDTGTGTGSSTLQSQGSSNSDRSQETNSPNFDFSKKAKSLVLNRTNSDTYI